MKILITVLSFILALGCVGQSSGGYILMNSDGTPRIPNGSITNTMLATPSQIGSAVYARVTGSNATTTGQALTNIAGLSVALVANAVYEFEANLSVQSSANTGIS